MKIDMRNKPKWYSILLLGLVFLLASSVVFTNGCSPNTDEVEWTEKTTLQPPFSEIIPTGEDLRCLLYRLEPYRSDNETIYFSDGSITYSRFIGNEDCFHARTDESEDYQALYLNMAIHDYQTEEQAIAHIQQEKSWYTEDDAQYYSMVIGLPLDDFAGYQMFWTEPGSDEVKGREGILFRVGHFVGDYRVEMNDPPELKDGYFIPLDLHYLLQTAVRITTPRLCSHVGKVTKEGLEPPFNEIIPSCSDLAFTIEGHTPYCAAPIIVDETTTQLEDGTTTHCRHCREIDGSVMYSMSIYVQDNETEAIELFQQMWGDCPDWAWHCELGYDPMPDDAVCFEDSDEEGAWASMSINFRVGPYICFYDASGFDAPQVSWDEYEESWRLSPTLRLILIEAVQDTISGLRSLEPT